jgi:hypothetical protein
MTEPAFIRPIEQPVDDFAQRLADIDAQIYQVSQDLDQIMNQPPVAATGWIGLAAGVTVVDWGPVPTPPAPAPDPQRVVGVGGVGVLTNVAWLVEAGDDTNPGHALSKIAAALALDHPAATVVYNAAELRIEVTAKATGSAGNRLLLTIGTTYASFLTASSTTLTGGKDGQVRQQLDAQLTSISTMMLATDRMLIQGRTDHKEVAQALSVYPPTMTATEAERRLTTQGYDVLCGKPLVRDGQHALAGLPSLINLLGLGPARDVITGQALGSLVVVPVITQQQSTPYQTSCGTVFRDEYHEIVLAVNHGPDVVPAGATPTYHVFHLGDLKPTATLVTRLQSVGFSAEQIGTMMNERGNAFNVVVTKISDPTLLTQMLTTVTEADLTEVSFRNIDDWVWNATAADWQTAVTGWFEKAGGTAATNFLKAMELINGEEIWPFGKDLQNALDQVGNCLNQKLIDLFNWLVAKIEWFRNLVDQYLVGPVTKFANAAASLKAFVQQLFDNFPGSLALCLLGDLIVNLLPQLQSLFDLVMLTITNFINSVMLVLTPLFAALSLALQPICLISGVVTGLLGNSIPGLECLPPLNIPVPQVLLDLLQRMLDFLKLLPMVIGILTDALASIFQALSDLLKINITASKPGTCNATSVSAMLVSLAAILGGLLAAELLKNSGLCPSTDLPAETPPATPRPDGTGPTGYCPT